MTIVNSEIAFKFKIEIPLICSNKTYSCCQKSRKVIYRQSCRSFNAYYFGVKTKCSYYLLNIVCNIMNHWLTQFYLRTFSNRYIISKLIY